MLYFKKYGDDDEDDDFSYDDDYEDDEADDEDENEKDVDSMEDEEEESESDDEEADDSEDLEELEEIEAQLDKGEDIFITPKQASQIPKAYIIYNCPRCKRIYFNKKWVKDNITDIYTVKTELAYCPKCVGKTFENFIGSVEVYDKKLAENKNQIIEAAKQAERELEDAPPFENIINIAEKNGILFLFTNTTRLALEIGKRLRQEFHGGIQYEWFERNQYLRVKWFDEVDNRNYFRERIRAVKERRFGMFSFEDED